MPAPGEGAAPHPIDAAGTAEERWQAWPGLARPAPLDLSAARSAVVVAPHPDDEVLGFGGALALLADHGARLRIVAVTDGEGSHPGSPTVSPATLARRRRTERAQALQCLGADSAEVVRLGLPDGATIHSLDAMTAQLRSLCSGFDLCATPWPGDLHPDHEAAGRAAAAIAAAGTQQLRYPVWMWHWAHPEHPDVPWNSARRIDLPKAIQRRKAAALECFVTQIAPLSGHPDDACVLDAAMLAHFTRDRELVF